MNDAPKKYAFGWIPDVPDSRDLLYKTVKPRKLRVPKKTDLRGLCSKVENQGTLGSCTANALAGNIEFLDMKDGDEKYTDASRLFIYYNERVILHTVSSDSGAMLRDGIKSLNKEGVCSESSWPYEIKKFTQRPPKRCYAQAQSHRIESYRRLLALRTC